MGEFPDHPTAEQRKQAVTIAETAVAKLKGIAQAVHKDKSGFEALSAAITQINPDHDATTAEGDTKVKEGSGLKTVMAAFKKAAKEIGNWANEFLTQLRNAPLSQQTKKDIADVCRSYKELLEETSTELQAWRQTINATWKLFDDVVSLLVPAEDVRRSLDELSDKETLAMVSEWAKENREGARAALVRLSAAVKDDGVKNKVRVLQEKWRTMSKSIENILHNVSADLVAFRKKMGIMIGTALCFVAAIGAIGIVASGGAAAAVIAPIVGTLGTWAAGGLAALTVVGLAVFGICLAAEPEIGRALNLTQEVTINAISQGLDHIASQADNLETILHFIYKDLCEVQANDPAKDYQFSFGKLKTKQLIASLCNTQKTLQALEQDIKDTEGVVDEELQNYSAKVYKPLLQMFK